MFKRKDLFVVMRGSATAFLFLFSIVVSGQQTLPQTDVDDVPVNDIGAKQATRPAQTFSNDQLQFEQRPELDQALDTLPGIQARSEGSPLISIRGSQSSARVLVLEEGVPLNFSDGVGFNPLYVASENLQSVTILKGPSSSLFGHDALAGVVEFNTEKLRAPKFMGSYGSFNESQIFAGAPLGLQKSGSQKFQITAYETYTDNNFSYQLPRTGASGVRSQDNSETTRFTLSGQSSQSGSFRWKTFNLITRQIGSTPGSLDFPVAQAYNNWGEINSLELKNSWDQFSIGSQSSYKYLWQAYSGSSPSATSSLRESLSFLEKFKDWSLELFDDFTYENFQANYLPGGSTYYPLNEIGVSAFVAFNEVVSLQGALRASNETTTGSTDQSFVSLNNGLIPSIGLIAAPDARPGSIKYFVNYSEGYHPPSITQLYAQYAGSPGFVGNTRITAERSQEFDLGFEKPYGNINTHFEAFSRTINNIIENELLVAGNGHPSKCRRCLRLRL